MIPKKVVYFRGRQFALPDDFAGTAKDAYDMTVDKICTHFVDTLMIDNGGLCADNQVIDVMSPAIRALINFDSYALLLELDCRSSIPTYILIDIHQIL